MSSVDERVVGMKFDNAQFENGVKTTLTSLEALNKSLKMEGATKGLTDLNAAGKNVQLGHISEAVDGIARKFQAMSVIAITALATIAHTAISTGLSLAKSLTIDPVKSGLQEYQTNINSIQTILSNTRWQNTGLEDVNKALNTLNEYSDQTIYNFSQMARNIGTFTAAGVKLDVATNAIKGIANLAAVSGSSAEQASIAMYQLSQAIATGTVKLIDWNSVVNAGMGGKVFQDALLQTARNHHIAVDSMIKDAGSFRATLEKGWLSSQILTETLQQFTGDMTEAQLISMGYTKAQAISIVAMGKDAQDAATKVKTITQLFSTLRESAGSGWAMTWQLIFGNFEEARDLFTKANDTLGGFVKNSADARNNLLKDWKELGGRTVLIEAISIAFQDLLDVLSPIGKAWRDTFPAATGQTLYKITVAIRDLFQAARLGEDTMDNLRRTFAGIFAIFGIGWDITKQLVRILFELFGMTGDGSSGFLEVTANIGDFLVALRKAINEGNGLVVFFDNLKKVLALPVQLLKNVGHLLASLFSDFDADAAAHGVVNFVKQLGPLGTLADFIVYAWGKVLHLFDNIWKFMEPFAAKMTEIFHDVDRAVGGVDFKTLLDAINTGALVALVVVFRNTFGRGGISGVLGELTETLSAMQTTLQATTLLEIALAIGILAVSISVLSKIDAAGLSKALAAISVMFVQLLASLAILSQLPGNSTLKLYGAAAAMTVMAVAINILALAVKQMSDLSWEELLKGLSGVVVLLAAITAAARFLPPSAGLISTGIGLLVLAGAIKVLASAVTDLSGLDWVEMAKGMSGVAALLASLSLFTKFSTANATGIIGGVGIILIATAIKILASAVMDLSVISWENIGKGMAVLATSLTLITAALVILSDAAPTSPLSAASIAIVAASLLILASAIQAISGISWENVGKGMAVLAVSLTLISAALIVISDAAPTAILSAGAILIVAFAVEILAKAIGEMGKMSWDEIVHGLVVLAGALAIIVVALNSMLPAVPGAFAMLIVANALLILSGVLKVLGGMSWGEIVKGLVTLAAAFAVIGIAAAVLQPVIPAMLGLGLAITLLGAGLALAGAGVFLFATGLTALSVAGAAGAAAIVAIVSAVIGLIPVLVEQVGIALVLLIDILIEAVPKIVELIIDLILQLFDGLDKVLPKLADLIVKLIVLILLILEQAVPKMVASGYRILLSVLDGIARNIDDVIRAVGKIIESFLRGIASALPGIIQAGVDLILAFVRGLTKAIDQNSAEMGRAGGDLAVAIIKGMVNGLAGGVGQVAAAAKNVAKNALHSALDFLGIASPSKEFFKVGRYSAEGMALGLEQYTGEVVKSSKEMGAAAMNSLRDSLSGLSDALNSNMDLTPTIRPVLDLTDIQKNGARIDGMLGTGVVDLNGSYSTASQASAAYQDNKDLAALNEAQVASGNIYNFNQYNTSPKALSNAEIYRQTNNQLSAAKGGLP
jgi:tape measure domain-containing protein